MTDTSDSDLALGVKNGKDNQKELLAAGSTALLTNSPSEAISKFKSALDKMSCKSSQKTPITHLVLRYALCIAYLKSNDFSNICEAAETLLDMIDSGYASKLPALYLAIAKAYFVLNRFNSALEFIEKGLKAIHNNSKIKQQSWPGLQKPIEETGKDTLHKELLNLQSKCKNVQPPDAICQYAKCIEYSTHVIPAQEIYFSDLDFAPFFSLQCDASCKFAYHHLCWEHLKNSDIHLKEPQELIGMACPTDSCTSSVNNNSLITEVNLIGSDGFDAPLKSWSGNKNFNCKARNILPEQNYLPTKLESTKGSTKAKSKSSSVKDKESIFDQSILLSSSIANSLCSSEDDVRSEDSDSSKFSALVETLNKCRLMKFGYPDKEFQSPQFPYFGHPFKEFSSYLEPDEIDKADRDTAEFVFSLYQSMFDKDGHYRMEDLQEKWKTTISDLGIPEAFTDKYKSVSEFLLKSDKFAAIDDVIGTSDLLPDMFLKAEVEITQSVSYLLFSQVANPRSKDICSDSGNDIWKTKTNNNNCDTITRISSLKSASDQSKGTFKENSAKFVESSQLQPVNKDKNDNPILSIPLLRKSSTKQFKQNIAMNGSVKPAPNLFVPKDLPQEGEIYLSEEDDEEEKRSSLFMEDRDNEALSSALSDINLNKSEGICKPDVTHQHSQTDEVLDMETENLNEQKDSFLQEISGLQYEKTELLQRIETLQSELENTRADLESKLATSTKQLQDFQYNIEKKSEEYLEVQEKNNSLEQQLNKLHEVTKGKDDQVSELEATLDKLRRSHAKEINNFGLRLREERKIKEEVFQDQLKLKDQKYIQLWKEYCEYKIKKFNHLCNDRINVLFQLKDMMSDSIRPTKSDIKSLIETYEEEMISVSQKNNEVNDVCNEELEKLSKDISYRPLVIDVPDNFLMNKVYPPEGAFEYLHNILKSKQDDFAPLRNHFSPAVSRFPRSIASNGLQSSSQTREPEPFSSMANTSLFGQGLNETSHLWNNSFSNPSAHSAALSFDVGNTNGPHLSLHQGFGTGSSIMSQQPGVNLMSPICLPFSQTSQPTVVQAMMGSARSTTSPLLSFANVNGLAFNSNASAGSSVGSLGAIQKPIVPSTVPKPIGPAVSTPAPTVVLPPAASPQGAVSKPRVQTATAAMTPIVPSKPLVRPVLKGPKTNESNYEKLMRNLQKMFPTRNDGDLTQALKMARHRNGGTLSSLTHSEIVSKVDEILSKQSKQTAMGWERFGQTAWGTAARTSVVEWEGANDDQDECCICMTSLNSQEVYTLECKHAFHKECIRKWLLQDGVCPMCRVHSTMLDEFPPLG